MEKKSINRNYLILVITLGIIIPGDQLSKIYIDQHLELHQSIEIIKNFFSIVHVRNSGIAFGLLAGIDSPLLTLFFVAVSLLAVILIVTFIKALAKDNFLMATSLSLILAGALGNLIDRIRLGEVIDFLDFYIYSHHWPAFNLADSSITVGGLILFICQIFNTKKIVTTQEPE